MKIIQTRVGDVTVIVTSPADDHDSWSWLTGTQTDLLLDDGWSLDPTATIRRALSSANRDLTLDGVRAWYARRLHYATI